jgi:phage tail-like protein
MPVSFLNSITCSSSTLNHSRTLYKIYRCWVSEYQALPDLDAGAPVVAIEYINLENEGWKRDESVMQPREP